MKYLSIYIPSAPMSGPPSQEDMDRMGKLIGDMMASGELVMTLPLKKREEGLTVTRKGDSYSVGKADHIEWMRGGGFAILEARDRDQIIDQAKRFLATGGDGVCEILACPDMG